MPYYTRGMVSYMRSKGTSSRASGNENGSPIPSGASGNASKSSDNNGSYYSGMSNATSIYSDSSSGGVSEGKTSQAKSSSIVGSTVSKNLRGSTQNSASTKMSISTQSGSKSASRKPSSTSSKAKPRSKSNKSTKSKRVLRVTPSCVDTDANGAISRFNPEQQVEGMTFDDKRLLYMKDFLKRQVDRIQKMDGAIEASGKPFSKYQFDMEEPVMRGNQCTMYKAKHVDFPDVPMVMMAYDRLSGTVPNPFYLKILRHLGKKHSNILQTWEIFIDQQQRTLIVQEFANRNDLGTYLAKKGSQSEAQVCDWARQLYKALDYLGDMAICHRNLKPRRVLLIHKELGVRLTGFYDAVIYWNVAKEDILNFPCIPLAKKNRDAPDFQAPEVHGDPGKEEFDPVSADVWSYSAIVYFMMSQDYPYDYKQDNPQLEGEIQNNIQKLRMSEEGKAFLKLLLTTNAMLRLTFERIGNHSWFNKFGRQNTVVVSQK